MYVAFSDFCIVSFLEIYMFYQRNMLLIFYMKNTQNQTYVSTTLLFSNFIKRLLVKEI